MSLTLGKIEALIRAACKDGRFHDEFYYEEWPHVTAKLFHDRKVLLAAAKKAHERMVPHSPQAILLAAAIEEAEAGYPQEPTSPSDEST